MKNKALEELAKQAFRYAADHADEDGKGSLGVFADKYAELIINECVDVCNKIYFDNYPDAEEFERSEEGDAIKKHFGVVNGS